MIVLVRMDISRMVMKVMYAKNVMTIVKLVVELLVIVLVA